MQRKKRRQTQGSPLDSDVKARAEQRTNALVKADLSESPRTPERPTALGILDESFSLQVRAETNGISHSGVVC